MLSCIGWINNWKQSTLCESLDVQPPMPAWPCRNLGCAYKSHNSGNLPGGYNVMPYLGIIEFVLIVIILLLLNFITDQEVKYQAKREGESHIERTMKLTQRKLLIFIMILQWTKCNQNLITQ